MNNKKIAAEPTIVHNVVDKLWQNL